MIGQCCQPAGQLIGLWIFDIESHGFLLRKNWPRILPLESEAADVRIPWLVSRAQPIVGPHPWLAVGAGRGAAQGAGSARRVPLGGRAFVLVIAGARAHIAKFKPSGSLLVCGGERWHRTLLPKLG